MIFFKWKTVYSEVAIQNPYKNCHVGNFGEIIVHYLKLGVHTLVKMPSNNFQFRTGANLSYFTVDEKHSKFPSGKKLILLVESGTSCWITINYLLFLTINIYLVRCFYPGVRFTKKNDQHVLYYQTRISEVFTLDRAFTLLSNNLGKETWFTYKGIIKPLFFWRLEK